MGWPARGAVEAEMTRMRDEPGLGRGEEGIVRPRPYRGVSDEAEAMRMRDEPDLGRGEEGIVRPRPYRGVSDEAENEQLGSPAVAETTGTWT